MLHEPYYIPLYFSFFKFFFFSGVGEFSFFLYFIIVRTIKLTTFPIIALPGGEPNRQYIFLYKKKILQNENSFKEIVQRYLQGEASDQEKNLVEEWYHSFKDEEVIADSPEKNYREAVEKRMKQRLLQSIDMAHQVENKKLNSWKKYAVAAGLIGILGLSIYFFSINNDSKKAGYVKEMTKQNPQHKIIPGSNQATLTLADGTVVALDNSTNKKIAQQKNISIITLANGQLTYKINGKTVAPNADELFNTLSTPRGGQYQLTLSDGTEVWLNAASSIRFPIAFTGTERKVSITGEAYFEVTKNKFKPFIVSTKTGNVKVLGTHFNVNAYTDEETMATTLLEGSVQVNSILTKKEALIKPGEQAMLGKSGTISIDSHAHTEEIMAWKNGMFLYKSTDLKTILRQISRWYNVDIQYNGQAPLRFTGQLSRQDALPDFLKKLELTDAVKFNINDHNIIVTKTQ